MCVGSRIITKMSVVDTHHDAVNALYRRSDDYSEGIRIRSIWKVCYQANFTSKIVTYKTSKWHFSQIGLLLPWTYHHFKKAILDCISRTAKLLTNRITNRFSKRPKTAGWVCVNCNPSWKLSKVEDEMYNFGQQYCGAARWEIRRFWRKGFNSAYIRCQGVQTKNKYKRIGPLWIKEWQGFFVPGQCYLAKQHQNRKEVTFTFESWKNIYPTTLQTVKLVLNPQVNRSLGKQ